MNPYKILFLYTISAFVYYISLGLHSNWILSSFELNVCLFTLLQYWFFLIFIHPQRKKLISIATILTHGFLLGFLFIGDFIFLKTQIRMNLSLILYSISHFHLLFREFWDAVQEISRFNIFFLLLYSILIDIFLIKLIYAEKEKEEEFRFGKKAFGVFLLLYLAFCLLQSFFELERNQRHEMANKDGQKTGQLPEIISKNTNILIFVLEGVSRKSLEEGRGELLQGWQETPNFYVPIPHSSSSIFALITGEIPNWQGLPEYRNTKRHLLENYPDHQIRFLYSGSEDFEDLKKMLDYYNIQMYDREYITKNINKDYKSFLWGLEDRSLVDLHKYFLQKRKSNFLHIIYFTNTHSPYFLPEEKYARNRDIKNGRERYISTIEYTLNLIREMIHYSEQENPKQNLYILLSDHGESFGEHGFYKHGFSLHDEELRVPFWTFYPGKRLPEAKQGSILDVFPSLLFLFGQTPLFQSTGRSIYQSDYQLNLPLHSWNSPDYEGKILKNKKTIVHKPSGKRIETDLD